MDQWNVRLAIPGVFCLDTVAKELVYQSLIGLQALKGCLHKMPEAVEGHFLVGYSAFYFEGSKVFPCIVTSSVIDSLQFRKQTVIWLFAQGKQLETQTVNKEGMEGNNPILGCLNRLVRVILGNLETPNTFLLDHRKRLNKYTSD